MNAFTRCLVEIQDGFFFEAIRWLGRGLSYNLHFPNLAIAKDAPALQQIDRYGVAMSSPEEAAEYLSYNPVWKQTAAQTFLRRVLVAKPLAERIAMSLAIKEQLKRRDTTSSDIDRPSLIEKSMKIFDEEGIREMMRELRDFV